MIEKGSKERLWHHCYGYLGELSLKKLAWKGLYTVLIMDYDVSKEIGFCETCIGGNLHRSKVHSIGVHDQKDYLN